MKQVTLNMLKASFFLIIFSVGRKQAAAQTLTGPDTGNTAIQYIRTQGDLLVFDLQLSNLPVAGSLVRVTDDDYNVLFEERIHSTDYHKRYKILTGTTNKLHFEVFGPKLILKQSFQVKYMTEVKWEVTKA